MLSRCKNIFIKHKNNLENLVNRAALCTLPRDLKVDYDSSVDLKNLSEFKRHPGKYALKTVRVPDELEKAINALISNHSPSALLAEAIEFMEFNKNRRLPFESKDKKRVYEEAAKDVLIDDSIKQFMSPEQRESLDKNQKKELDLRIRQKSYNWFPIHYTERMALTYLVAYFVPEYATLKQIFHEIECKDPDFKPTHIFDFGSGVGTVMWAANSIWKSDIKEVFNSDISAHMNNLSQSLLRYGEEGRLPAFNGVTNRRSFPASSKASIQTPLTTNAVLILSQLDYQFELVTSSFSLFEMKHRKERLETIRTLWNKVATNGYLVLVDKPSSYGYELIMEARDYILNSLSNQNENTDSSQENSEEEEPVYAHVFSPVIRLYISSVLMYFYSKLFFYKILKCPHDAICPAQKNNLKCTARVSYFQLNIYGTKATTSAFQSAYSYVVIKKSARSADDNQWPRFVYRDPAKIRAAYHAYFCTKHGHFDHFIATKDRSKDLYRLIKNSKVLDQLPGHYGDSVELKEKNKIKRQEYKKAKLAQQQQANDQVVGNEDTPDGDTQQSSPAQIIK